MLESKVDNLTVKTNLFYSEIGSIRRLCIPVQKMIARCKVKDNIV